MIIIGTVVVSFFIFVVILPSMFCVDYSEEKVESERQKEEEEHEMKQYRTKIHQRVKSNDYFNMWNNPRSPTIDRYFENRNSARISIRSRTRSPLKMNPIQSSSSIFSNSSLTVQTNNSSKHLSLPTQENIQNNSNCISTRSSVN